MNNKRSINVFMLAMINVAAICSIKNWPVTAEYGLTSLIYFTISIVIFFIPVSLVSAELATGWPRNGGVYLWVKEAFGHKMGFLAAFLLWMENVVWYPTILSFIAGTIAFCFAPDLAANTTYLFFMIIGFFWLATLVNFLGMKVSGWISSVGVIVGTIIPGLLIISLAFFWIYGGNKSYIIFSWDALIPKLSTPHQLSLLTGVLLGFAGMEMSAVHANVVKNPQKNYPLAILISSIIIVVLSLLGTLSIAIVIPREKINLVSGSIEAISLFLNSYNLGSLVPFIAIMIVFGAMGGVSTWAAGPTKSLLAAAQDGDLPPLLHKVNKNDMPTAMLTVQGVIVSIISTVFLLMPNVNSSFWILLVLASQLYLVMYILMFAAGIKLRFRQPHIHRSYKIPGGLFGIITVSGVGILGALFAFIVGFFPPLELDTGSPLFFQGLLTCGILIFCSAPFVVLLFKKPSWNENGKEIKSDIN